MKFSEQWLREWVNPPITGENLANQLTLAGLEVDSVTPVAPPFERVVIGQVIDVQPHPNADRLRVCCVDVGDEKLNIVCGAQNVRRDLKVPVAKVGAVLPGGVQIKKSNIRGVESCGMICSENELGLADTSLGIMELPDDASIGMDFREYLLLDDQIIDIDLTPNRGDCLSILGIAREVAVFNKIPLLRKPGETLTDRSGGTRQIKSVSRSYTKTDKKLPIRVLAPEACPRYVSGIIRNINTSAVTPVWMIEKLRRSGIRAIHPVVDITNYVMLELGQPLHAFDLDKLSDTVEVRFAQHSEEIILLDGQRLGLDTKDLVIADQTGIQALAGIMGGARSSVTSKTTSLFLESAYFKPSNIAVTARRYGLQTDSSHRFERGVDPSLQMKALQLASELIIDVLGGELNSPMECVAESELPKQPQILLRSNQIQRVLGITLSENQVAEILHRLGMIVVRNQDNNWQVLPPSYRFDINVEVDLIEELARVYGYAAIPYRKISAELELLPRSETKLDLRRVRSLFINRGYQEAITYSFVDPKAQKLLSPLRPLELLNPISFDLAVMRINHWPGLIQAYLRNQHRQQTRVRLFEIGTCFIEDQSHLHQPLRMGGLISGDIYPEQWGEPKRPADFFDIKSDLENLFNIIGYKKKFKFNLTSHPALHPGKSAEIQLNNQSIGYVGALHPKVQQQLNILQTVYLFDLNLENIMAISLPKYETISKFPAIRRDIAIVLAAGIPVEKIVEKILDYAGELLKNVQIFDIYQGKGIDVEKKSIALGLTFQHISRTLVDAEVNDFMQNLLQLLHSEFNVTLRD
jgi:phenylalanyl-tRNA synthetase beta chain